MLALVTGATGFVGSHVARELAAQGADLRLLVRSSSNTKNLDGLNADRVIGDLRDPESLKKAVAGCDYVFHIAADYRLWTPDSTEMYASNVNGTRNVLHAAQENNVKRVVYCSSVATMGFTAKSATRPVTEADPVAITDMIGHYKRSKFMAEQVALDVGRARGNVVVVNPTTPVGERDIKPTPTGRIIVDFLKQNFPAYVDTGLNLADVKEVARGHILAMERARPGERYILGGENLTLKQILDKLADLTGLPSPTTKVPHTVAMAFAYFDEFFTGTLRGQEPRATVEAVRMGKKKMFAASDKAVAELGYRVVSADDALRRAVSWFRANGYA
jgi:dihydroflavonol-4-reductase